MCILAASGAPPSIISKPEHVSGKIADADSGLSAFFSGPGRGVHLGTPGPGPAVIPGLTAPKVFQGPPRQIQGSSPAELYLDEH